MSQPDPYEGVEDLGLFGDRAALDAYRASLLAKSHCQVDYIQRHLGPGPHDVLELASGNGRLLFALHERGMLRSGVGVERAGTRVAFASRWAHDLALAHEVSSVQGDLLLMEPHDLGVARSDLVICITGALGYFLPIHADAPRKVLDLAAQATRRGGHLLLEIYLPGGVKMTMLEAGDGHIRTWEPLSDSDPFAYYLSELEVIDGSLLRHTKTFVARDGSIDSGRVEELALYTIEDVTALVDSAGFEVIAASSGWDEAPWSPQDTTMVVLARRSAA